MARKKRPLFKDFTFGSKYKRMFNVCPCGRLTTGTVCRKCYRKNTTDGGSSEHMTDEQLDALVESRRSTMPDK